MRFTPSVAVGVAASLFFFGSPAAADRSVFRDGDEQPFCEFDGDPCPDSDYMDFRTAVQGHGSTPRRVQHGFRTRHRWPSSDLDGYTGVTIYFEFDTDRNGRIDRLIRVRQRDGRLRARLYKGKYFQNAVTDDIRVWRPRRRALFIAFPADILRDGIEEYRWSVTWADRNISCPGSCHNDWAPDRGWYAHLL